MKRLAMFLILVLLVAFSSSGCGREAQSAMAAGTNSDQSLPFQNNGQKAPITDPVPQMLTAPAGSILEISMGETLSSASARAGDRFGATLEQPLVVNGETLAPRGAQVTGRVVAAHSSGRLHNPGYLRLTLASINVNGHDVPLETSSVFFEAGSHKKRNWAMIGGGSAAGALIGGLAAGPKGMLIGSAIGAGAGTGTAFATGKKEVSVGAEHRLAFRLLQPLTTQANPDKPIAEKS